MSIIWTSLYLTGVKSEYVSKATKYSHYFHLSLWKNSIAHSSLWSLTQCAVCVHSNSYILISQWETSILVMWQNTLSLSNCLLSQWETSILVMWQNTLSLSNCLLSQWETSILVMWQNTLSLPCCHLLLWLRICYYGYGKITLSLGKDKATSIGSLLQ